MDGVSCELYCLSVYNYHSLRSNMQFLKSSKFIVKYDKLIYLFYFLKIPQMLVLHGGNLVRRKQN